MNRPTEDLALHRIMLDQSLRHLPIRQRTRLVLNIAGYSLCEVGQVLGISYQAIQQTNTRSLDKLRFINE